MNSSVPNRKFWSGLVFVFVATLGPVRAEEAERVYSLAEVADIDRENKLWRAVDVTRTVEFNVDRWLAGGCSPALVEALRPRLAALWQIDPWLHFGWLAPGTAERIQELTPAFSVRLREARVSEMLNRLGGEKKPLTSAQVYAEWRSAIERLLDDRELRDVVLLNSVRALALYGQMKDLPLTVDERRSLCLLQQDHEVAMQVIDQSRTQLTGYRVALSRAEAWLDYWQQMRDLLGDERFAAYLRVAEDKFARMAGALAQVGGLSSAQALDLWWVRKKDALAGIRQVSGSERTQLQIKAEESASAILGPAALAGYETNDDARWLLWRRGYGGQ